jgi:hypothetical protein
MNRILLKIVGDFEIYYNEAEDVYEIHKSTGEHVEEFNSMEKAEKYIEENGKIK